MDEPTRTSPVVTVAVTLAGVLVWQSIGLLVDVDAAVDKFRLVDSFAASTAREIVVTAALVGLIAAGSLLVPRTRAAGGALAATALCSLAGYLVVVWLRGDPVQCLCTTATQPRGSLAHLSSILLIAGLGALAGFVAVASRRARSITEPTPHRSAD